jgi:hypothetical protein
MSHHEEKHQAAKAKVKQNEQDRPQNQQGKQPGNRPQNQQGNAREENTARPHANESARWTTESERPNSNR